MKKIISVVGARPNFIKIAPVNKVLKTYSSRVKHIICHTGQHFDEKMSKVFFEDLELPKPDYNLEVHGGSHAEQTAKIMVEFEKVLLEEKPDLVIVVGDVNSTLACSITASKLHIKVAHIEAGLRSFDREMPEEINRILTDVISDFLFVTEDSGLENLDHEGIDKSKVHFVGNVMIDSLYHYLPKIEKSNILKELKLTSKDYILFTFHRPRNVDSKIYLTELVDSINQLARRSTCVFPVHPRTANKLQEFGLNTKLHSNIIITEPIGYIDFMCLVKSARLIITDSGGIQEESTYLGVQCITVRDNTERPVTVKVGTNQLIGRKLSKVINAANKILDNDLKKGNIPELWDGKAAERIIDILSKKLDF